MDWCIVGKWGGVKDDLGCMRPATLFSIGDGDGCGNGLSDENSVPVIELLGERLPVLYAVGIYDVVDTERFNGQFLSFSLRHVELFRVSAFSKLSFANFDSGDNANKFLILNGWLKSIMFLSWLKYF